MRAWVDRDLAQAEALWGSSRIAYRKLAKTLQTA